MSDSETPWTVAHQTPLSMGFSRQEHCSGLPSPSPEDFPNPGTKPDSLHLSCIGRQVLYHQWHLGSLNVHKGSMSFRIVVFSGYVDCWVIWQLYSQFFEESPYCSPQQLYQFPFPPTVQEGFLSSISSPEFIVYRFFDDGNSDLCEVISRCSFDVHFFNNEHYCASFHIFVGHLYFFFGEMSAQVFCPFLSGPFVFLVLSCVSCLYILEINPLPVVSFAIIFSYSESCLYIQCMVPFVMQKLLSLTRSHLFIFVFISITLGGGSQRILL